MKLIERQKCPYCEEIKFNSLFKKNYSSDILQEFLLSYYKSIEILDILKLYVYEIVECIKCTGMFQKYVPDDNLSYYLYEKLISADDSFNKKKNIIHTNFKEYSLDAEIIKKLFKKDNDQIKILEFGCGWGFWAKFMKELNFDVETIEISKTRIDYLKKNKIRNYENINELVKNYDLIFASRYEGNGGSKDDTIVTFVGNKIFTLIGNILFKLHISDILFTYIMAKTDTFRKLKLRSGDFRLCVEIPIKSKIKKLKYTTISTLERKRFAGKKNVNELVDGYFILSYLIKSFLKIKNE